MWIANIKSTFFKGIWEGVFKILNELQSKVKNSRRERFEFQKRLRKREKVDWGNHIGKAIVKIKKDDQTSKSLKVSE